MEQEKLLELSERELFALSQTKAGRFEIFIEILKKDNLSIAQIVKGKETALNKKLSEQHELLSGLAFRSTAMFGETTKK